MPLKAGDHLGPYEILALIGKGGMGEVYRAHDPRLRRDVAIKTSGERFNERFSREARAIAALNHPNICTLYDIGPDYLVMELVEGNTPAGPLKLDAVLIIADQIAAALEQAHEKGIVHRDLKPANVKITPNGTVKVLDFGLAKMAHSGSPDASTITMGLTEVGSVMGTPAYMAPEQAEGKDADKRADVWAFGVVLYELHTGQRPFRGDSVQATLAAVMTKEPDLARVPAKMQRLLRACLKKDPKERLSNIGDWRLLLDEGTPASIAKSSMLPWVVATAAIALAALGLYFVAPKSGELSTFRFGVPIPGGAGAQANFALSPDGRNLAITASKDGQTHLRVRPLDEMEARLLPAADGADYPFWSPDGKQIGFFANGKLKTISVTGSEAATLTDVEATVLGGTWGREGMIVFSQSRDLYKVEERGGKPVLLYHANAKVYSSPYFLPDGRHFLFYLDDGVYVGDLDASMPVKILPDYSKAVYSSDGYIHFLRRGQLTVQPFDPTTFTLSGTAIPMSRETVNFAKLSAGDGILAYQARALAQLTWVDRSGKVNESVGPPEDWSNFRLSPDQTKIAVQVTVLEGGKSSTDIARFDLQRGTQERLTSHAGGAFAPVFSANGQEIAYSSLREGRFNPFVVGAANQERQVTDMGLRGGYPVDWSPDGKNLLYWGDEDLWIVPQSGTEKPYPFAKSRFDERAGTFSPDGKWIAYLSNESGRYEVYLRPFPAVGGQRYTVSSQGGSSPAWRRDGKELYYAAADGRLTAVPVTITGSGVQFGRAETLFPVDPSPFLRSYEPSLDGQRFLVARPAAAGGAAITVMANWQQSLGK